jgi:adenine-specific DNA-methyltransferase
MTLGYIGSKKSLIDFLDTHIRPTLKSDDVFADLFAGTGVVAQHFSKYCSSVVTNDAEQYSFVINYASNKVAYTKRLESFIDHLNSLPGNTGIVTRHFATGRMFFTQANARKIDAIRHHIQILRNTAAITMGEYYFLLASLLVSADKIANTASIYCSYLKQYKKSALRPMLLTPIHTSTLSPQNNNKVYCADTLRLIKSPKIKKITVAYFDPPYNQRQYSANYNLLNYIVVYDPNIAIYGTGGLIKDYFKSPFSSKTGVIDSFHTLIKYCPARTIFISYNNEGLVSKEDLLQICNMYGSVQLHQQRYKKFLSHKDEDVKTTVEYLFEVHKK